ncbi:MAG: hypothetical protein ACPIOQ_49625, partial [Promethearchaeia archaeon]
MQETVWACCGEKQKAIMMCEACMEAGKCVRGQEGQNVHLSRANTLTLLSLASFCPLPQFTSMPIPSSPARNAVTMCAKT